MNRLVAIDRHDRLPGGRVSTVSAARRLNRAAGLLAVSVLADSAVEHYRGSFKNKAMVTTDDHTYEVDGDVWSNIPLRNRREGMVTRITEGMTKWKYADLEGAGLSEYLDQVVDDVPVGTTVGL